MNRYILRSLEMDEDFWPFKDWPLWAKQSFLKPHKNRNERYYLWIFLWKNGMEPHRASYWVMKHGGYDREGWQSIRDLENKAKTPHGRRYLGLPRIWDMELRRPTSIKDLPPPELERTHEVIPDEEDDLLDMQAAEEAENWYKHRHEAIEREAGLTKALERRRHIRRRIMDNASYWNE